MLGYKDVYHYASVFQENPRDAEMWTEAFNAKCYGKGKEFEKADWDQLLGHCMAITDTPAVLFYRELLAAYPDAKVILTERDDAEQWHRSQLGSVTPALIKFFHDPSTLSGWIKSYFSPIDTKMHAFNQLAVKCSPMYQALFHDWHTGEGTAKEWYGEYNKETKKLVPREKLLVYNVKQGLGPLCEFLEEKPPPVEFPGRNDTRTVNRNFEVLDGIQKSHRQKKMLTVGGSAAAVVAVVVGLSLLATSRSL